MMPKQILIGYTVGPEPCPFYVEPRHMIITGMTGQGKGVLGETIARSWPEQKIVVFVTKDAEEQFKNSPRHTPFYRQEDTSDWRSLRDLIEVSEEGRSLSKDEEAILAQITKGTHTLQALLEKMKEELQALEDKKRRGKNYNALYLLTEYVENLIAKLQTYEFTDRLDLKPGVNVMDISNMAPDGKPDLQAAVIGATLREIYANHHDTTGIIMEAGKILPYGRKSPALQPAMLLTQEGRVKNNWLIFDLQHLKGLHADVKPNVDNYFLGKQKHGHEIDRMREALEMDPEQTPTAEDIKNLRKGQFYVVADNKIALVYVKPFWMPDDMAIECAKNPDLVQEIREMEEVGPAEDAVIRSVGDREAGKKDDRRMRQAAEVDKEVVRLKQVVQTLIQERDKTLMKLSDAESTIKQLTQERADLVAKVADLQTQIDDFAAFRATLAQMILPDVMKDLPVPMSAGPHSMNQVPLLSENVDVVVSEQTRTEKLDDSTMAGRLCLLILDGFFDAPRNVVEIRKKVYKEWGLSQSGKANDRIDEALLQLTRRGWALLVSEGEGKNVQYQVTEKGRKIHKSDVVA